MNRPVSLDSRLYGMAQRLLMDHVRGVESEPATPRELVDEQDAVDAVAMIMAAITDEAQAGRLAPGVATRLGSLLMVVRDRVRPLPAGLNPDGTDQLTADLAEMVAVVRTVSRLRSLPGQAGVAARSNGSAESARAQTGQGVT